MRVRFGTAASHRAADAVPQCRYHTEYTRVTADCSVHSGKNDSHAVFPYLVVGEEIPRENHDLDARGLFRET